ncbi:MAG: hypothetical protein KDI38_08500 [Calditrichaeota bacterium]|nr:hypothetical protein [Calditrichota bacterium]MCB0303805.1 hypothetical protein [Calditrichota bacterium]MCB0311658.1 hypothetical protein [Calditrichota bacterium]MCB9087812.1 hypothetical protein [Calditrichia bacterium]
MHFCKSKKHVWSSKKDAEKCCNGYERVMVFGDDIPPNAKNVQINSDTGIKFSRIWVKVSD